MDCLFCKIIAGEIPSNKVYEDDKILCFRDINPQAEVHALVVPKKHIACANEINAENSETVAYIFEKIPEIAKLLGVSDYRIIVIEKFGYGYSDLYERPCDIDSVVDYQRKALRIAGEKGPYILLPHSMSGLEAIRWKQKYPDEVKAIIGLDMAVPGTYLQWNQEQVDQRIRFMRRMRKLNDHGLLFWYPLSKRGLNRSEIKKQQRLLRRNAMNPCYENEARAVLRNAEIVDSGGVIECPILMFVSAGR